MSGGTPRLSVRFDRCVADPSVAAICVALRG